MKNLKCQCCNFPLPGDGMFEICLECYWEQDMLPGDDYSFVNGLYLHEAKSNYSLYGAACPDAYWNKTGKELNE